MAHALPYTSFTTGGPDASLDQNDLLGLPAIRASISAAPVSSFTVAHPYQVRASRRPRDASKIHLEVFFAMHKVRLLARRQSEVSQLASDAWRELSEEGKLIYETMARLEREVYERDILAQHRGSSAGSNSSRSNRCRSRAPSRSVADLPHELFTLGIDAQASIYRAPAIAPTAAPEIPRIQYPASFPMNTDGNVMLQGVHVTQRQGNQQVHAAQGMQAPYQPPASISVPTTVAESSDSQIHNHVPYYHVASSQSFNTVMNQAAAIAQYLPSAPVAAPVARRPNPVTALLTHHQLDGNTNNYNNGWGEPSTTYASSSSFVEVGPPNHGVGSNNHDEGAPSSGTYYELPAENTWNGSYGQHQLLSSDYSGQRS